jgi:hypothetical protein
MTMSDRNKRPPIPYRIACAHCGHKLRWVWRENPEYDPPGEWCLPEKCNGKIAGENGRRRSCGAKATRDEETGGLVSIAVVEVAR